ncbi:uncharacterized protein LOC144436619 [Glandiceps talaboti]
MSRQSKRKRPSTDYDFEEEEFTPRKSSKRAKKATESVSSFGSVSMESSDENSDWPSYDQSLNRPSRVRKKSAKLLEAEEEITFEMPHYSEQGRSLEKKDKKGKNKEEEIFSLYQHKPIPELKISIGKEREEKGSSKKSKEKKKKSSDTMTSLPTYQTTETLPETKHRSSSKKSKKNIPLPFESYPESPTKDSGIKLKLILSPKEKEKNEPFYEISSPEAEMPPSGEKEKKKKKKKEKESVKTKLTFQSDGSQQSSMSEMELGIIDPKKSKKKKKKHSELEERQTFEMQMELLPEVVEKPPKKKRKKGHTDLSELSAIPDFEGPSLVIDEKPHKEKKKKQKKDKKEKEKKEKKEKSKDKSKDRMKIKFNVTEHELHPVGVESQRAVLSQSGEDVNQHMITMSGPGTEHVVDTSIAQTVEKKKKPSKPKERKEKKDSKKGDKKGKKDKKEKSKKPLSAYMLWCNHYRSKLVADNPGIDFSTISKKLGAIWQQLSEKEKGKWKRKQKAQKTKHKNVPNLSKNKQELKEKAAKQKPGSPIRKSSSPLRCSDPNTEPIDVAAYLKLLGESLSLVGHRLQEHQGNIEVHGSLSVLLDSTLCALGPLLCLTSQVKELDGCPHNTQISVLENIAYIMPGL